MSRILPVLVFLAVLLGVPALADDPAVPAASGSVPVEPVDESFNLCPDFECEPGGGGGGYSGCYDCSSDGTNATCDPDGRYWADCVGGSICWYMSGAGWYCEPYCGRRRCYNI